MQSDPQLWRWYLYFDREFFNGDLPKENIIVHWEPIPAALGMTEEFRDEDGKFGGLLVKINPALRLCGSRPRYTAPKLTLVHEQVHVKLWHRRGQQHGKLFDQEMQRLCQFKKFRELF